MVVSQKVSQGFFEVTSRGLTGEMWLERFEELNCRVTEEAKVKLLSGKFVPTTGTHYKLALLLGAEFEDEKRITSEILTEALKRHLSELPLEAGLLLREEISSEEMESLGLCLLVIMHKPFTDPSGRSFVLGIADDGTDCWLSTHDFRPDRKWFKVCGFAFLAES